MYFGSDDEKAITKSMYKMSSRQLPEDYAANT